MTLLQDLYYGNINPDAEPVGKDTQYARAQRDIVDRQQKLLDQLDDATRQLLEDYSSAQSTLNALTAEDKFIQGFHLGARMMLEVSATHRP